MSANIREVARALGLSERAVRLRLDALGGTVAPYLRRGPNNAIIFTSDAVAVLRRAEELRRNDGISVNAAAAIIRQSDPNGDSEGQPAPKPATNRASVEALSALLAERERLVTELQADRDHWRTLALRLQEQATPALPAPRRFLGLFRRVR